MIALIEDGLLRVDLGAEGVQLTEEGANFAKGIIGLGYA
jgi:hypothetical protein